MKYFGATSGAKYENPTKGFSSYFLSFGDGDCRIELMHTDNIVASSSKQSLAGFAHIAISVGGKDKVDSLTERIRMDGFTVKGEPRITGDGYYESVVLDPEGNTIEITA